MPTAQLLHLYSRIEADFELILASPTIALDSGQRDDVHDFIAHREYDEALSNLMAIMLDDASSLAISDIDILTRINCLMKLPEPPELLQLRQHVEDREQPRVMHR